MLDIIFISYNEPTADKNFENLKLRFPYAQRVHGVTGIHQAHIAAAKLAFTKMFWVVDGDAEIVDTFDFSYRPSEWDEDCVHVWRSLNPINNLQYGYGGVKLLPRKLTLNMDVSKPDMTTSISTKFKPIKEISNITKFNTDPYNTWKSAFRECVKLSSKIIDRQKNDETEKRLDIWCSVGEDKEFGEYALDGARTGRQYGEHHRGNLTEIYKINDFGWLRLEFDRRYGKTN